jgi:lipid A ethanolaminephosphotransferase
VLAPDQQKRVPFVVWAPTLDHGCLEARRGRSLSHDNLFDTVLGLFEVATTEYRIQSDVLRGCALAADPVRLTDDSGAYGPA